MHLRKKLFILFAAALAACLLYLLWGLNPKTLGYTVPRRLVITATILLTGASVGFSTVIFQTVTNNRILTPSIIGLDSLYLFIQTVVVFFGGSRQLALMTAQTHFLLSVGIMVLFALLVFKGLFNLGQRHLYTVILAGVVLGGLFSSLSTFMQVLIDPNEFLVLQDKMFSSFNQINTSVLKLAALISSPLFIYGCLRASRLDVMSLGRDSAVNLGIDYEKSAQRFMIVISILVAVSTALVGPITFLGLLTANISRELLPTYKHSYLIAGAVAASVATVASGLFIVERVLTFSTTLSVIINFAGGIYFVYLLMKERKA